MAGDKNVLVSAGRPMEDDHNDLTRGADPMQADGDQIARDYSIPDLHFLPAHASRDIEVMRSCVFSHMSEGLSKRKIVYIEKVLAIYNRNLGDEIWSRPPSMMERLIRHTLLFRTRTAEGISALSQLVESLVVCFDTLPKVVVCCDFSTSFGLVQRLSESGCAERPLGILFLFPTS
ncbi:hypothetical protein Fot_06138 [Forsythia ovata]|uniref:Uncharacterized protein n=1 Tax=Forsythia ovata TaxID=205694 RepID=A0ABD1WS80_9LAMI